jgi:hypothetical protein
LLLWPAVISIDGAPVDPLLYLPPVALFGGWLLGLCDSQIYMLYQGRRYWPMWLRGWALRREQKRPRRLEASAEQARARGDRPRYLEACSDIARFPLAPDGERHAAMPTRLGNLMYEYELYPSCKYGLDSVFFFYWIWVSIDKDLRDEIDRKQASVDGAVYLAFVLALAAVWFFAWFWLLLAAEVCGFFSRNLCSLALGLWGEHQVRLGIPDLGELAALRHLPRARLRRLPAVPLSAGSVRRVLQVPVRPAPLVPAA